MSTPTVTIKPSEQLTVAAKKDVHVHDKAGRVLTLFKPNINAQFNLVLALGDNARNSVYMSMVTPMTYLKEIDGVPVNPPTTMKEVQAIIQRLDEDGMVALMKGIEEHFAEPPIEAQEAALKNS